MFILSLSLCLQVFQYASERVIELSFGTGADRGISGHPPTGQKPQKHFQKTKNWHQKANNLIDSDTPF